MTPSAVERQLRDLLSRRILILDGAMGTMIQRYRLGEADFRGTRFAAHTARPEGNNELLQLDRAACHPRDPRAVPGRRADIVSTTPSAPPAPHRRITGWRNSPAR